MKHLVLNNRLPTILAAISGLLLLILILEISLMNPLDIETGLDSVSNNAELITTSTSRFIPAAQADFSEVLTRPLFFEGRKMPAKPVSAPAKEKPKTPLRLKLEGVAISADRRTALLRNTADNRLLQLVEGASHLGWTLQTLGADSAKFLRGDEISEIRLEVGSSSN